jgi:8-oxo-dGTP pyrophosphatase MutT (NUDIX family)
MELKKTESAGGVVLNKKGEVLIVNQHGNSWSLPKGHVEQGEEILEAAKREIYEESGIKYLKLKKGLGCYTRYRIGLNTVEDRSELKEIHMFLFNTQEMELNPVDVHNPEARWVLPEEVCTYLTHEKDKQFFRQYLKSHSVN